MRKLTENVFAVGAIDWDRRLFDELIPLPDGTSYNSYLIKGSEKLALIDTVDPEKVNELIHNLDSLGIKKIDYVIANHAEQDHSGSIPEIVKKYNVDKVVTNSKCKGFLIDLLHLPEEKIMEVKEGEGLSLGDKTLQFLLTPWVHWPETMSTYLKEDKILFSCDFFGSHLATSDLFVKDKKKIYPANKRYYAEIMMPFRSIIKNNMKKLEGLDIQMIAPSHGPVFDCPQFILDAYNDWISDNVKDEVVIPYVSMHGSTKIMVDYLVDALIKKNIKVKPFNLTSGDLGDLAMELVDAATVVFATPTVLTGPHPKMVYAAFLLNALRPKTRYYSVVGSFGWAGRTLDVMKGMLSSFKAELIYPVIKKGLPKQDGFNDLDILADAIKRKHDEDDLIIKRDHSLVCE